MIIKRFLREMLYRIRGEYTTEKLVKLGLKVGKNFLRLHGVILDPSHCWLITIGDNVTMAPNVHILAHDASTCYELGYAKIGRVNIGNNVFIGASTIVLPDVTIGDRVIIGAGAVVSKNLESDGVYAGNPAKRIMSYNEYIQKQENIFKNSRVYGEEYTLRNKNMTMEQKEEMYYALENSKGFVK
ncbi:MAG: acyltransferase [Clostridia bacterium]|nr:acyltransferase [Clostridia bacterium]